MEAYNRARKAMIALGQVETSSDYPPLTEEDTYMRDYTIAHKVSDKKEGWIWRLAGQREMTDEEHPAHIIDCELFRRSSAMRTNPVFSRSTALVPLCSGARSLDGRSQYLEGRASLLSSIL